MMRLLPRSLGGQLSALLICGLLAAHLVTGWLFSTQGEEAMALAVRHAVAERVAALAEAATTMPADHEAGLAQALSSRNLRFSVVSAPPLPDGPMTGPEAHLAELIRRKMRLHSADVPVRVGAAPQGLPVAGAHGQGPHVADAPLGNLAAVAVRLPRGRWLHAIASLDNPEPRWPWAWLFSLICSAVVTLSLLAVAARRITGPMGQLALAAERVGRGEPVPPIPASGPSEIETTINAFNLMHVRLERHLEDRLRIVGALSHDIRSPITSLRLRAEFIEDEDLQADVIRILNDMEAMASSTLSFARADASTEALRDIDLAALIEGIVADQQLLGRKVRYHGPDRLVWRGRSSALGRAVTNLVENAVRYGGAAEIRLAREERDLRITVEDRGPGIPPSELERVFEPFVRLEASRSRDTGGSGLGLPIARAILRAHGGELVLANRRHGGLRATVTLP